MIKANSTTYTETKAFDKVIIDFMNTNDLVGASVGVTLGSNLVYAQGYGYANQGTGELAMPDSLYRIASVTKPITSVTILKLVEAGKLNLTDTVFGQNGILSDFRPKPGENFNTQLEDITITHLLQHTGGWNRDTATNPFTNNTGFDPMFYPDQIANFMDAQAPASAATIVRFMLSQPLQADLGTVYAYSNFGYCVLGRAIEKLTDSTYIDCVKVDTLVPMGVWRSSQALTKLSDVQPDEVHYYPDTQLVNSVFPSAGQVPQPYGGFYIEAMDSHGGWISSVLDLLRIANSIDGRSGFQFLSDDMISKMMAKPAPPVNEEIPWYGMGWSIRPSGSDYNWWHQGKLISGTSTELVRANIDTNISWSILFNKDTEANFDSMVWDAINTVRSWPQVNLFYLDCVNLSTAGEQEFASYAIPDENYQAIWNNLTRMGYRLDWFNAYPCDGNGYFNTIFVKDSATTWASFHNLTGSAYQEIFDQYVNDGYYLYQVNCYALNNMLYYGAIFKKGNSGPWVAYHGYTVEAHQNRFNELVAEGYRIVNQSAASVNGKVYVAALYDKQNVDEWTAYMNLTADQYQQYYTELAEKGQFLSYIDVYDVNGTPMFSGIWNSIQYQNHQGRHNLTESALQVDLKSFNAQNLNARAVVGYQLDDEAQFAAFWTT